MWIIIGTTISALVLYRIIHRGVLFNTGSIKSDENHHKFNHRETKIWWDMILFTCMAIYDIHVMRSPHMTELDLVGVLQGATNTINFSDKLYWPFITGLWISITAEHLSGMTIDCDKRTMDMHHLVTLVLVLITAELNIIPIGATIHYLHNVSDVPLNMLKLFAKRRPEYKKTIAVLFIITIAIWIPTRCIGFPLFITRVIGAIGVWHTRYVMAVFALCILYCLNIYWIIVIIRLSCKDTDKLAADYEAKVKYTA